MVQATYHLYLDTADDGSWATEVTSDLVTASWNNGFYNPPAIGEGMSPPSEAIFVIDNGDGSWTLDDSNATYKTSNIHQGLWIKLTGESSEASVSETDLFIGRFNRAEQNFTQTPATLTLYVSDLTLRTLDGVFFPRLEVNRQVSYLLTRVLRSALKEESVREIELGDGLRVGFDPQIGRAWRVGDTIEDDPSDYYDLDSSRTRLPWYGDGFHPDRQVTARSVIADLVRLEMGGVFYWDARQGKYRFLNRDYQLDAYNGTTYTFLKTAIWDARMTYGRDTVNRVYAQYEPRVVGPARDLLFLNTSSYPIPYGRGHEIRVSWQDTSLAGNAKRVLATDVIDPVLGVDVLANTESDGSGDDVSADLELSFDYGYEGTGVTITVDNVTDDRTVYITTLRIYGRSLKTYSRERVIGENETSISNYGEFSVPIDISGIGTTWQAQAYADHIVLHGNTPETNWEHVTLFANRTTGSMTHAMNRTVGQSVRITEDAHSQHDNYYTIVGEQHRIDARIDLHFVTYTLKHFKHEIEYFEIGTDTIGGSKYIKF